MKFKHLSLKNINNLKLIIYILLLTFLSISSVHAATYNYYFSNDATGNPSGKDSTGDGSVGNPWKTLSKAQTEISALSSSDTVNLYFDRGDTWTMDTDAVSKTSTYGLTIGPHDPIVNIDAYGSGNKPKFYGTIVEYGETGTDFSEVPSHNATNGPYSWNRIFQVEKDGCSFKNIHVDGVYGHAIFTPAATATDSITIESCDFTNFGSAAWKPSTKYGTQNSIITKNLIRTGQQLYRFGKRNSWGFAVSAAPWNGASRSASGNTISYNVIYNIYGEGIHGYGYTAEYNTVGDTGSYGIYVCPALGDATNTTIRYNFVMQSSSNDYKKHQGSAYYGIVVADEKEGGSNSSAKVEIYGNAVINRLMGIVFTNYDNNKSPWAEVRIFNNTIIDSSIRNMYINHGDLATAGYWYNNSSILYDRTGDRHAKDQYDSDISSWVIKNNIFWTTDGSPKVDTDWSINCPAALPNCVGNPKLAGEEKGSPVAWVGQSGATYYKDITFADVMPTSGSDLIDTGKIIPFDDIYLSGGSDFTELPTTFTPLTKQQLHDGKWDVGAIIFSENEDTLQAPVGLKIIKE